jgi:hypothetical protein
LTISAKVLTLKPKRLQLLPDNRASSNMQDDWTYHRAKKYDRNKVRWHFVTRYFHVGDGKDEPRELYFRNDDGSEFGMLRFEKLQDNPYRSWDGKRTGNDRCDRVR